MFAVAAAVIMIVLFIYQNFRQPLRNLQRILLLSVHNSPSNGKGTARCSFWLFPTDANAAQTAVRANNIAPSA